MNILCLDLEGVLVPEVWQAVADATQIDALRKTTRDIPDYDELMQYRLGLLAQHELTLSQITDTIAGLRPLAGAVEFLQWARQHFQIAIVSDTFYEFAGPLMVQLGHPMLLCHRLEVRDDRVVGYHIRQPDPKRCTVRAFKGLNYTVFAAGDSFNDVTMLEEADYGFFFCAPEQVTRQYPDFACGNDYAQLRELLTESKA